MSFECQFITQSPCKCDCSISQESIKQPWYLKASFSFCKRPLIFFSSWGQGICEKSHKEICIACSKSVFTVWKHAFPNTVNSIANLLTLRNLTNKSMVSQSAFMEWQHQTYVSRLRLPFPLPSPPLGSLCLPIFFVFSPCFWPFPPLWSLVPS